jgi:hypothetical protein
VSGWHALHDYRCGGSTVGAAVDHGVFSKTMQACKRSVSRLTFAEMATVLITLFFADNRKHL